jgi:AbrB family looped-hinge helix DNA binding protein
MTITSRKTTRPRARVTSQGQITVPKAIRDRLGVKPGDDLEFVERGDEIVIVPRRRRSVLDFAGALPPVPGVVVPTSSEEWKQAIRDAWTDAVTDGEAHSGDQRRQVRRAGG